MNLKIFASIVRRSVVAAADDNCFRIAKAVAYSALLSFFPLLASAAALLVETRAQYVAKLLQRTLSAILPPGTEDLVVQQFRITGDRPIAVLLVAASISVWAASSVVTNLIDGFQAAYRVPQSRSFVANSAVAMALVIASAVPLLVACLLLLFGGTVDRVVLSMMKVDPVLNPLAWVWQLISRIGSYLLAFATTVMVTSLLYYFGPNRRQQWRYVWPGAMLATAFWMAATVGFGWYVKHIGRYNVMYGSIGAGIALLVWMYVMSAIALIGCEFNAEYERSRK
jgi:membrane protein